MSESESNSAIRRLPPALTPETKVVVQLGGIMACAIALISTTVYVSRIAANGEQALSEIRAMRDETTPALRKVDRLWWEYEQRHSVNKGALHAPSGAR